MNERKKDRKKERKTRKKKEKKRKERRKHIYTDRQIDIDRYIGKWTYVYDCICRYVCGAQGVGFYGHLHIVKIACCGNIGSLSWPNRGKTWRMCS